MAARGPFGRRAGIDSIGAILLLAVSSCAPPCTNDVVQLEQSPDMRLTAQKFSRNCGATTPFNVQISISRARGNVPGTGNTFIADGGGKTQISIPADHVRIHWMDNRLVVEYDKDLRIFKQEREVEGIQLLYEAY